MAPSDGTTDAAEVYDALAPIYDAAGGDRPFALLAAERLERRLGSRRDEALSILDLGCGTGTLLLALAAAHPRWRLCGVDASAGMLAVARAKPDQARVLWTRARLPAPLPFGEPFDVVGAFYDTLNHLPDPDALAAAFRTVASVLRPGGLLVFDLNNVLGFERLWRHRVAFDLRGHHIDTRLRYDASTQTGEAAIDLTDGDGRERRLVLRQRCFSDTEVAGALLAAGLKVESAAPFSPIDDGSPSKTWFVATKEQ